MAWRKEGDYTVYVWIRRGMVMISTGYEDTTRPTWSTRRGRQQATPLSRLGDIIGHLTCA